VHQRAELALGATSLGQMEAKVERTAAALVDCSPPIETAKQIQDVLSATLDGPMSLPPDATEVEKENARLKQQVECLRAILLGRSAEQSHEKHVLSKGRRRLSAPAQPPPSDHESSMFPLPPGTPPDVEDVQPVTRPSRRSLASKRDGALGRRLRMSTASKSQRPSDCSDRPLRMSTTSMRRPRMSTCSPKAPRDSNVPTIDCGQDDHDDHCWYGQDDFANMDQLSREEDISDAEKLLDSEPSSYSEDFSNASSPRSQCSRDVGTRLADTRRAPPAVMRDESACGVNGCVVM